MAFRSGMPNECFGGDVTVADRPGIWVTALAMTTQTPRERHAREGHGDDHSSLSAHFG
jgi:hypothetical protein